MYSIIRIHQNSRIFKTISDRSAISGKKIVNVLQARTIALKEASTSTQKHIAQLKLDETALTQLEQKIASGISYEEAYAQSMTKASIAAKEYAIQTRGLAGTTETFIANQKEVQDTLMATTASSKLVSIGIKALSAALNAVTGMAIMWGISKVMEGFKYLSESAQRAKIKLTEIQTELSDNSSSYKTNRKILIDLQGEYDSLTKKAKILGGIQNLTNSEYERYEEITSQILGITPKLTTGWNNEGVAISNKNNLLQLSIDLLDEEYEKSLRNNTTKSKNEEVASGVIAKLDEFNNNADTKTRSGTTYTMYRDFISELKYVDAINKDLSNYDIAKQIYDFLYPNGEALRLTTGLDWIDSLLNVIIDNKDYDKLANSFADHNNPIYNLFSDEVIDNMIRNANAYKIEGQRIIEEREALYQGYKDQLNWNAQAAKDNNDNNSYQQLTDNGKAFINEYINGLDYATIKTENDFVKMANEIKEFTSLLASNDEIAQLIESLFSPANNDETSAEYVNRVQNAIENIQKCCADNYIDLPITFRTLDEVNKMTQAVQALVTDEFDGRVGELTYAELQIAAGLEIADDTLLSWDELIAKIEKAKHSMADTEPQTLFTQLTASKESLDTFRSSVKSVFDAYSTLLSGDYSSSELLDSIQAINQAVGDMGGSLNWEFIDSQSNSLEVLGNAIEYVSEQYANSILSDAGIDPGSDFGEMLAGNIIQAQKAAAQLEAVNGQIDSLQEAYQNLTDVVDTYNRCGHITFEQLQNLLGMEPQYLACLIDENGQLQLNRQAMQELADKRLYEAKVQAVQQAISELGTLTHHDEQKAIVDSAQAFRDSVSGISAYNEELAKTLVEAGIAAPLIRDLNASLSGAEERGASGVDIRTVIDNLNAKMKLINSVDTGNLSSVSSSAAGQAETDWKSLLDKETDLLEKQLAANLIAFQEYIEKRRQIIEDYYHDGRISAEEYYDALESMYGSRLSLYARAVNAVTGRIDDEIDRLNEQKEAIENSYQIKIDAIQAEIDALNKANDARRAQIDLEKAQYEAERARNQRVSRIYDGSQFVYTTDMKAVRDAEENLADRKTQISISRLEAQIESLEREMENATKGLDSQIEALESYKEKWNEISGTYEEQQNRLIAAEILGADWESQVLNGRLDTLRSFTEQYIALQQAQADAAANAARIKAEAAAGNTTGGSVGSPPATQGSGQKGNGDDEDTNGQAPPKIQTQKSVPTTSSHIDYTHFNRDVTRIYATMARFHGGLDEGYATASGQSTPAGRSLSLLQKLAGEKLLPGELPAILQHGELVITPEQQRNIIANTQRYCSLSSMNNRYAFPYPDETSQIHIDNLTISCPNVTNNTGAEYILKSIRQLPLDNIQHSRRRRY